jgi:hypothetical protein
LLAWLNHRGGTLNDYVSPSRVRTGKHLSTRQNAALPANGSRRSGWVGQPMYGTHSLRRTRVALIYERTGNLRAVQLLLGCTRLENTVRYLGVDAEGSDPVSGHRDLINCATASRQLLGAGSPSRAPQTTVRARNFGHGSAGRGRSNAMQSLFEASSSLAIRSYPRSS